MSSLPRSGHCDRFNRSGISCAQTFLRTFVAIVNFEESLEIPHASLARLRTVVANLLIA
jgi:NhaP-type Na+/H+ or K+/H+ antiporter